MAEGFATVSGVSGVEFPDVTGELPFQLTLELVVHDSDSIAELWRYTEGDEREQFALNALRIGILALRQARGQVDGDRIRREAEKMLADLQGHLTQHASLVQDRLTGELKNYFDPESGRFQERINRLIRKDGELEELLRRLVGDEDSALCKTLTQHIGSSSPLMKLLNPDESDGLISALRVMVEAQLTQQRERVLTEFSLDNKEGALARLVSELNDHHGELSKGLQEKIDVVVKEFSLDEENSALCRLVKNVDRAQRTITSEFSLDNEASALCRLRKILENTNQTIHDNLTLDDDKSALSLLRRELLTILKDHAESNQKFQEEVNTTLTKLVARREEAALSTRHGLEFEAVVCEFLTREAQRQGDIATPVGNTVGLIKSNKVGDCVIELGPDSAAPGAKIVVEAKEKENYTLAAAREEIEEARKNRGAQIGLFIFSQKTAPALQDSWLRYGNDIFVVWNPEDPTTDLYVKTCLSLARALCIKQEKQSAATAADFQAIDKAILEVENRASLSEIEGFAKTIQNRSEDILKKVETSRKSLLRQVEILREKTDELKTLIKGAEPAS